MTRGRLRDSAEWLLARLASAVLRVLPDRVLVAGMSCLSRLFYVLARTRRKHAEALVEARLGLPAGSPEARRIVRGAFETLALNAVGPIVLERRLARGERLRDLVVLEGEDQLREALASGRGVLLCSAHIGAWESFGVILHGLFERVWCVARELDNPRLERELVQRRMRWALGSIPKKGGGLKLARALKAGEPVFALLDQNAGSSGALIDFLGEPASQHTMAGVLARRCHALVVPVYLVREPDGRLRFIAEPALRLDPRLDGAAAELDVVRRLSASVERQVRARPGQWLWLHDRWRHARRVLRQEARAEAGRPAAAGEPDARMATAQGTNGP